MHKLWQPEEINLLKERVGSQTVISIAKELGRTPTAVSAKMSRLGLCNTKEHTGMVTAGEIAKVLKVDRNTVWSWIQNYGLKAFRKTTKYKRVFTFIDIEDFWSWAEIHKQKIDFSKIEPKSLPPEPLWVRGELKNNRIYSYRSWTSGEEIKLLALINLGYSMKEISKKLNRPIPGIQKKYSRLQKKIIIREKGENPNV